MRHGAHKAPKASQQGIRSSKTLFAASRGSHRATGVAAVQLASGGAAMLGIDQALADKLNEVAPQTRRAMRQAARAAERRSNIVASASLAALVGTAASIIVLSNPTSSSHLASADEPTTTSTLKRVTVDVASRSESRTPLGEVTNNVAEATSQAQAEAATQDEQTSNEGTWQLNDDSAALDVNNMSRSLANNPNVAALMDADYDLLPEGFDPNHITGERDGNAYPYGQCTWWAYKRRAELGLPVGSYFGNGNMWADSARNLGYWVDGTARHVGDIVVFQTGQVDADPIYGHVSIVEAINADGSIEVSESNVKGLGVVSSRTISAQDAAQLQYIHY